MRLFSPWRLKVSTALVWTPFCMIFSGIPPLAHYQLALICMPNTVFGIFDAPNMDKWGYPWKDHAKYHLAWFPHCRSYVKLQSGGLNRFMGLCYRLYYRLYKAENRFVPFLYKVVSFFKSSRGKLKKKDWGLPSEEPPMIYLISISPSFDIYLVLYLLQRKKAILILVQLLTFLN